MRDTGGPAFPFPGVPTDGTGIDWEMPPFPGMTLEDYYAGEAMKGLLANSNTLASNDSPWETFHAMVSERASAQAASMIAEKRRREG